MGRGTVLWKELGGGERGAKARSGEEGEMVKNGGVLSGKGEIVAEVCLARRRYWNALKSFKVKDKERERGKRI